MKLNFFYEGEHFSVYYLPHRPQLPALTEEERRRARLWEPRSENYPNRVDQDGNLYYVRSYAEPSEEIRFVEDVNQEEWLPILEETYRRLAFRVAEIPLVFCLNRRSFVVEKSKVYELPLENSPVNFLYARWHVLRTLDRWGLIPKLLEFRAADRCRGYVEGGLPVSIAREEISFSAYLVDVEPLKEKVRPAVPLFTELLSKDECWLIDKDDFLWTAPTTVSLTPEEVRQAFNITTDQSFAIKLTSGKDSSLCLDLDVVAGVESRQPIEVYPWYGRTYNLCWRNQTGAVLVDSIKLKKPHFFEPKSALIGCLADLPQVLETQGLVKLSKKLLAGRRWFELYYIEEGTLKPVPGRYARLRDTCPSKYALDAQRKERTQLLAKLQYILPGDPLEWTEEQYIEYDRLLRSGEYAFERIIRIGREYRYHITSREMQELYGKAGGIAKRFESRPVTKEGCRTVIVLYRIVDLPDVLEQAKNGDRKLDGYKFLSSMYTLLQKGFPRQYIQEILDKVFDPGSDAVGNHLPAPKEYFEPTLLALKSCGVSDETLLHAFSAYLDLPQISRLALQSQYLP